MRSLHKQVVAMVILCAAIAFFVGYQTGGVFSPKPAECPESTPQPYPTVITQNNCAQQSFDNEFSVRLKLPAVDRNDQGALADLVVERTSGDGEVFVRFSGTSPLINPDTQTSLRTALDVAEQVSGKTLSGKNLYYSISTSSDVVGGQSAGAAMTIATIAALKGEALRPDALITGTINADGSIGQVGKVYEKAQALKADGYTMFVVPAGEGKQSVPTQDCEDVQAGDGTTTRSCSTSYKIVDIGKEVGINVVEAKNIREAYALMKRA